MTNNPTPTQPETLLPCPWCRGPAAMLGTNNGDVGDGYMWKIGCAEENDCAVQPEFYYESEQLAVTRWNARAAVAGPFNSARRAAEEIAAEFARSETAGWIETIIKRHFAADTRGEEESGYPNFKDSEMPLG